MRDERIHGAHFREFHASFAELKVIKSETWIRRLNFCLPNAILVPGNDPREYLVCAAEFLG